MSDITFVTAPIGGGKSLYATIQVMHELERTERRIVTNLPLKMDKVAEYCHKYIDRPIDLGKRVRLLNEMEVYRFFRYTPSGDLDWHEAEGYQQIEQIRHDRRKELFAKRQGDGGIFYVLDECHIFFPAREWQKIGTSIEDYMSQLRKLNDDLLLITQHPEKVDKNFRRNATQWIYVRNMGKSRLMMGVGLPGRFRYNVFANQPVRNDKPDESGWFQLKDRGYQDLYDTMAGVGLAGRINPETKSKRKHWGRWVVALVLVMLVAWFTPRFLMYGMGAFIGSNMKLGGEATKKALGTNDGGWSFLRSQPSATNQPVAVPAPVPVAPSGSYYQRATNELTVTGLVMIKGFGLVSLSDGTNTREFKYERGQVYIDGKVVPWNRELPVPAAELRRASAAVPVSQPVVTGGVTVSDYQAPSSVIVIGQEARERAFRIRERNFGGFGNGVGY